MAAAAYLLVGTTVPPQSNGSTVMGFRQLDEAIPRTDTMLTLSRKVVLSSEILGLQGIYTNWSMFRAGATDSSPRFPLLRLVVGRFSAAGL